MIGIAFLTMIQNLEAKEKVDRFDYIKIKKFTHMPQTPYAESKGK